jgi:RND family efflux transporter MFP subunit
MPQRCPPSESRMPSENANAPPAVAPRGLRVVGILVALAVAIAVVAGILSRNVSASRVRQWTEEQAVPTVALVMPSGDSAPVVLDLPGRLEALSRAPIYARVSGYLKSWKADIGAHVKAGELLAEIEAPDVDEQLKQAEADLATADANATLARSTAERWAAMLKSNAVSQQQVDEKVGDAAAKEATVKSQRANVERLRTQHDFERIVAPFEGTVTARDTDVGALINAGSAAGQQLFVVSDTRRLRVYVNVPQAFAANLARGTRAQITVPEREGSSYAAVVEATSGAVDVATGTTLFQLSVDNAAGELLPGGYASVRFELARDTSRLHVPASALIFDRNGLSVATLDAENHVVLKTVTIARDNGSTVEIATGLDVADRVIETPPDGVVAGSLVRVLGPTSSP